MSLEVGLPFSHFMLYFSKMYVVFQNISFSRLVVLRQQRLSVTPARGKYSVTRYSLLVAGMASNFFARSAMVDSCCSCCCQNSVGFDDVCDGASKCQTLQYWLALVMQASWNLTRTLVQCSLYHWDHFAHRNWSDLNFLEPKQQGSCSDRVIYDHGFGSVQVLRVLVAFQF